MGGNGFGLQNPYHVHAYGSLSRRGAARGRKVGSDTQVGGRHQVRGDNGYEVEELEGGGGQGQGWPFGTLRCFS